MKKGSHRNKILRILWKKVWKGTAGEIMRAKRAHKCDRMWRRKLLIKNGTSQHWLYLCLPPAPKRTKIQFSEAMTPITFTVTDKKDRKLFKKPYLPHTWLQQSVVTSVKELLLDHLCLAVIACLTVWELAENTSFSILQMTENKKRELEGRMCWRKSTVKQQIPGRMKTFSCPCASSRLYSAIPLIRQKIWKISSRNGRIQLVKMCWHERPAADHQLSLLMKQFTYWDRE